MKYCVLLCMPLWLWSQEININLPEIVVTDFDLEHQRQYIFSDSTFNRNSVLLTGLLNYNTPIYFKENGYGMVSSPSFRGTTASQTAVFWNGISINSSFLGQSDFNTITTSNYDNIQVKSGGESVVYGSGAIGGSIHLNNQIKFNQGFQSKVNIGVGSYNSREFNVGITNSNSKLSWNINGNYLSSDNDYKIAESHYINRNAQFWNSSLNTAFAYKIDGNNMVSWFMQNYKGTRHFQLSSPTETPTKYLNHDFRNLIQWDNSYHWLNSRISFATLEEKFNYFPDIHSKYKTAGKSNNYVLRYNGNLDLGKRYNFRILGSLNFQQAKGENTGIKNVKYNNGNFAIVFSENFSEKWKYNLGLRKEFQSNYKSPILYSASMFYKNRNYKSTIAFNRNFRAPSLNDMYWVPGGNMNLKAEKSYQLELNQSFNYWGSRLLVNLYWNQIQDMIRWIPTRKGYWSPENVDNVRIKGLELILSSQKNIGKHTIKLNGNYTYNESINLATQRQMIYVPFHKLGGSISYQIKNIELFTQAVMVGKVYTQTDHHNSISNYGIINLGSIYTYKNGMQLGFKINNLTNEKYQVVENKQMPPLNYLITFNLKI